MEFNPLFNPGVKLVNDWQLCMGEGDNESGCAFFNTAML